MKNKVGLQMKKTCKITLKFNEMKATSSHIPVTFYNFKDEGKNLVVSSDRKQDAYKGANARLTSYLSLAI